MKDLAERNELLVQRSSPKRSRVYSLRKEGVSPSPGGSRVLDPATSRAPAEGFEGGEEGREDGRPAGRRVPSPAVRPAVRDGRSVEFGDGTGRKLDLGGINRGRGHGRKKKRSPGGFFYSETVY
jgi:hypothetical protein